MKKAEAYIQFLRKLTFYFLRKKDMTKKAEKEHVNGKKSRTLQYHKRQINISR